MSVRPNRDIEEDVFQKMIEPFDPTNIEVEQRVTDRERESEDIEENHDGDEAVQPKTKPPPAKPSAEEVEKHMVTHLPFRDWCPHCVRGKSGSKPHTCSRGIHEIPTVALDYMYMHSKQEENEERGMPIVVTKDLLNCGTIGDLSRQNFENE